MGCRRSWMRDGGGLEVAVGSEAAATSWVVGEAAA